MAITSDQVIEQYGTPDGKQPLNVGIQATVQLYRGTIAVMNGPQAASHQGYLKNGDTPATSDIVLGILSKYGPGSADALPGLLGGSTDGATTAEILTGTFLLNSGTGADQLSAATAGQNVYLIDSVTVGLNQSGRPIAGVQMPAGDVANLPTGVGGKFPIKLGTPSSPLGGP